VRLYPPGVTVICRSQRGRGCAPDAVTQLELKRWLLLEAARERELLPMFESFLWRMVAAGLPLDRATLHIGTLHPQLLGFAWNWRASDGLCDEVKVQQSTADTDAFRLNPLRHIFEQGVAIRRNPQTADAQAEFPIMRELAGYGYQEYLALPLGGDGYRHAVTFATMRAGGFRDDEIAAFETLLSLFTLHVERHIAVRIANNTLGAYLGPVAAAQVMNGAIKRGGGQSLHAMIWVSDLRGFTDLSDRLPGADMIELLNAYFEAFAGAVLEQGGEVLKFIGDGLLAVFPLDDGDDSRRAGTAALNAAVGAQAALDRLNQAPPPRLASIESWRPLRAGIAVHEGEVFFGNIGAPERLDFTVIGPAVNEAARVEALHKTTGCGILITEAAARHIDAPLLRLGDFNLRGIAAPLTIFTPAAD
jgi:adenylate cyclase